MVDVVLQRSIDLTISEINISARIVATPVNSWIDILHTKIVYDARVPFSLDQ